jgi:tetratricopeptide (TPR) repeat protein/transcriptional regulator with XRE-family HTH domain
MDESVSSFGYWVRRRRLALDLTRVELARQVGCAPVTIKKIEADERRPSRLMAERLARCLSIPAREVSQFIQAARGERSSDWLELGHAPIQSPKFKSHTPAELSTTYPDKPSQPFVGRQREIAALLDHLNTVRRGDGRIIFISGEAGRGKTTLLVEFARQAMVADADLIVASGNCNAFGGTGDPYLPFRDVLNQLAGDLVPGWDQRALSREHAKRLLNVAPDVMRILAAEGPELVRVFLPERFVGGQQSLKEEAGRSVRFQGQQDFHSEKREQIFLFGQFTQVFHTFSRQHPSLILLDDLQWADHATISLLFHLGMRLAGTRMLIACAYRPVENSTAGQMDELVHANGHPFNNLVYEFRRRFGEVWIDLSRREETENWHFLNSFLDTEPNHFDDDFRKAFFRRTQGHPLFTVEMLRDMQARGDIVKDESGNWVAAAKIDWIALPARVEAVIRQRIENLSPDLRQILSTGSVEGEIFTVQGIAQVLKKDERSLLRQLSEELEAQSRLVREVGEVETPEGILTRYRFQHVLFQEYLYRQLSRAQRRLLHLEIANTLESLYGSNSGEIVVDLAHHFRKSGVRDKALEFSLRAAERAESMFAYDEAVQQLQHALELLPAGEEDETRLKILEQMADDYFLLGERPRAVSLYEQALELIQSNKDVSEMDAVRLHRKAGETVVRMISFQNRQRFADQAREHFKSGLKLAQGKPTHPEIVRLLATMSDDAWISRVETDWKSAEEYAQQALHFAENLGNPVELSLALEALANLYGRQGLFRERLAMSLRRLELSRGPEFRDLRQLAKILQQVGFAYSQVGEYRKALPYLLEAEALGSQTQTLDQLYRAIRHQATCYFRLDEWDKVLELDAKQQALEKQYQNFSERGGSTCYQDGLTASVHALRGEPDQALKLSDKSYATMITTDGPPEHWWRDNFY